MDNSQELQKLVKCPELETLFGTLQNLRETGLVGGSSFLKRVSLEGYNSTTLQVPSSSPSPSAIMGASSPILLLPRLPHHEGLSLSQEPKQIFSPLSCFLTGLWSDSRKVTNPYMILLAECFNRHQCNYKMYDGFCPHIGEWLSPEEGRSKGDFIWGW